MEGAFEEWDAEDVLVLARMWQGGDVGVTRADGDYEEAMRGVEARVLVMPGRTDQYFAVCSTFFSIAKVELRDDVRGQENVLLLVPRTSLTTQVSYVEGTMLTTKSA